ncbi:antibiotic biosynthesis monooxygenase [Methylosinus sp. R-45379]|jgi:quinol monooxygenase YgiN|uniref:putative quinol monooxygenase n=1 Tax=unclassified Methylosinus TaxID=2624500 RepID=UPI00047B11F0|nr:MULTISPECIES: putative quinol monooxygenase [unclassified Methylosinus]OAI26317.1 antibiotic biosynthesis monooxygenase [Methylosinus sp. R-45379]TDX65811.1 quinol monooxygenase YgiN [Methylosinus sp. sav-2]
MPQNRILIVGTIRIPPDALERALPAMTAMIHASRAEADCLAYSYAEDVLEPGLIRVTEIWESRAALSAHFESAHLRQWRDSWEALGVHDRRLAAYEIDAEEAV